MARSAAVKKLMSLAKKAARSNAGMRTSIIVTGASVGSVSGIARSQPGLRKEGAREGAIAGGIVGGALAFSPSVARFAGRTVKAEAKRVGKKVVKGGKYIFRRIRGKIVRIKAKGR